jgi:hypothetical protein
MATPNGGSFSHTPGPFSETVFDKILSLETPLGVRPSNHDHEDGYLVGIKDAIAQDPEGLRSAQRKHGTARIPVLSSFRKLHSADNQLWGNGQTIYEAGMARVPPNSEFVGTLMVSDTVSNVPARLYYNDEQRLLYSIVHDANLHALEVELKTPTQLLGSSSTSMTYASLKTNGAAAIPSFLRAATEPYYLVREGVVPYLAMCAPATSKELTGSVLDKGNTAAFVAKLKESPNCRFVTVFTKSCPPPPPSASKLNSQEAKAASESLVQAIFTAIFDCTCTKDPADADSEVDTATMTPSPPQWSVPPMRHLAVRAARAKTQLCRTLYGARSCADVELCLLTSMTQVASAISKQVLSSYDSLLLGHFLSERFRSSVTSSMKVEVLQAIAEALDSKCSLAFVTLETGGGGALAPPLLLAHAGQVVETTSEHLARLLESSKTAVIKFSHMENRVRQVNAQGLALGSLLLSNEFRTKITANLIHDSRMEVVLRPRAPDVDGFPHAIPRAPEGRELDEAMEAFRVKRRRVEERAEQEGVDLRRKKNPA